MWTLSICIYIFITITKKTFCPVSHAVSVGDSRSRSFEFHSYGASKVLFIFSYTRISILNKSPKYESLATYQARDVDVGPGCLEHLWQSFLGSQCPQIYWQLVEPSNLVRGWSNWYSDKPGWTNSRPLLMTYVYKFLVCIKLLHFHSFIINQVHVVTSLIKFLHHCKVDCKW